MFISNEVTNHIIHLSKSDSPDAPNSPFRRPCTVNKAGLPQGAKVIWDSQVRAGHANMRSIGTIRRISWRNPFGIYGTEDYAMLPARKCHSHIYVLQKNID